MLPEQILGEVAVTLKEDETVTVETAVLLQLPSLPVTVYVVVVVNAGVVGFDIDVKPPVHV